MMLGSDWRDHWLYADNARIPDGRRKCYPARILVDGQVCEAQMGQWDADGEPVYAPIPVQPRSVRRRRTIRTLCTGGGLFDLGAMQAGYRHVDGWEIRPDIAAVANRNGLHVQTADITRVDWTALTDVDHLHASPSCKTASLANTRGVESPDDLAVADAICRAIAAHQGATFSLENVWAYRHYESFDRILAALHQTEFTTDMRHVNAADYGVPQTRKRLILRAVRGGRVPPLHPTHRQGGDMFHAPWVGWYAAIADLLPNLPPTQPAPWQVQRLERTPLYQTTVIGSGGYGGQVAQRAAADPMFTLTHGGDPGSTGNAAQIRAFLVGGGNTNLHTPTSLARDGALPAFTVCGGTHGSPERAFLLTGGNTSHATHCYPASVSAPTVTVGAGGRLCTRAYVGRWVRLTVPALARLQTVPDDYCGLTSEINGNGVPCRLARHIMESFG